MYIKAQRTICFSKHSHPSKSEANYCNWLLARKQNKEIKDFWFIQPVELHMANGKLWKKWAIDFGVTENDGETTYHECKGFNLSDQSFRLKMRAFMLEYPERKLYVNKILMTFTPQGRVVVRKCQKRKRSTTNWYSLNRSKKSLLLRQKKNLKAE